MRRWAATIAAVASAVLAACGGDETRVTTTSGDSAQTRKLVAVSMVPPANADEMTPGVFVLTMKRSDEAATRIETAKSFMLQETMYDANGHEAGASVPSTTWSLLGASSRAHLAGMKLGEVRRVWTCTDTSAQRCKVEDVELLSVLQ